MRLKLHGSVWFRRVPVGGSWWSANQFTTSVRRSALVGSERDGRPDIAVFIYVGGGARSVTFDDLRRVADASRPRLDGDEFTLHFRRRTADDWECNGTPVDLRDW